MKALFGGLPAEGNSRFKIDWASLIGKFTVFALFYFLFEGNFASTSPPGGREGLIFGAAI